MLKDSPGHESGLATACDVEDWMHHHFSPYRFQHVKMMKNGPAVWVNSLGIFTDPHSMQDTNINSPLDLQSYNV